MMSTARTSSFLVLTTAIALGLSGCGNGSHTAAGPASSGTVTAPAHPASAPASAHSAPAPAASSQPAAPVSAPAAAAPAPAATPASDAPQLTLVLGSAVTADHHVAHPVSGFKPSEKAFYVSVSTNGKSLGGTLNAKWLYLEGKKPLVISSVSQLISADAPSSTTFTVHNPNPWPEGHYKVEISLDGKSVGAQEFQVH
ncbi:hypothetical protein ACYJW8_12205 [Frateuria aurantia]